MRPKRLRRIEVAEKLAEKAGVTVEQAKALLQAQAELAYAHAGDGFPIPGIGVMVKTARPEWKMVMQFGPRKGEGVIVPATQKINFRVARIAKEMVFGPPKAMPDIFAEFVMPDVKFAVDATELPEPSRFLAELRNLSLAHTGEPVSVEVYQLHDLFIPSGRIVAADFILGGGDPFTRSVPPGRYPLALVVAQLEKGDPRVALAILRFSTEPVASWEPAMIEAGDATGRRGNATSGYGVDSGTGGFSDLAFAQLMIAAKEEEIRFDELVLDYLSKNRPHLPSWTSIESPSGSAALFSSGFGDGSYASYFGLDESGSPAALLTDFQIVKWR